MVCPLLFHSQSLGIFTMFLQIYRQCVLVVFVVMLSCTCAIYADVSSNNVNATDINKYLVPLGDAIRINDVAKSYADAFFPYLPLKWISTPVLGGKGRLYSDADVGDLIIYTACRPHACDTDKLFFIYKPIEKKGWGVVRIKSDISGAVSNPVIEKLFSTLIPQDN